MNYSKLVVEMITALLMVLWIYTGLNKLLEQESFETQLRRSPFVQPLAGFIALVLPTAELLLAGLLLIPRLSNLGLYLSFALMLLFTGYVWMMLKYAYDLPCSCGGALVRLSWSEHLTFNIAFTLLALTAIVIRARADLN